MSSYQNKPVNVFIGFDERQELAYEVCRRSILQASPANSKVRIFPLKHRQLRQIHLFNRVWTVGCDGITRDVLDERPFSTNFAFTRFLVPAYADYWAIPKEEPCIFVDSDFVFTYPIQEVLDEIEYNTKPIHVVKHNYNPANVIKMDHQVQTNYNKKLWSSFMIFNRLFDTMMPTVDYVNTATGTDLHQFKWLKDPDLWLGSIYEGWNFIPNHSEKRISNFFDVRAVHYTEGTPLTTPNCRYAHLFNSHLEEYYLSAARNVHRGLVEDHEG